jgi:hypothetical protein
MKEEIHNWLTEKVRLAGVLACGIRAPDRKTFIRSQTPQFNQAALEHACRCLGDTFQVLNSNHFPSQMIRWIYQNHFVYGFIREDGHCLAILAPRAEPGLRNDALQSVVGEFQHLSM